jgi:hypothetical protein
VISSAPAACPGRSTAFSLFFLLALKSSIVSFAARMQENQDFRATCFHSLVFGGGVTFVRRIVLGGGGGGKRGSSERRRKYGGRNDGERLRHDGSTVPPTERRDAKKAKPRSERRKRSDGSEGTGQAKRGRRGRQWWWLPRGRKETPPTSRVGPDMRIEPQDTSKRTAVGCTRSGRGRRGNGNLARGSALVRGQNSN